jgi:hypothetical protein
MDLHIGVWLMLALRILYIGISLALHGQDKRQTYSVWLALLDTALFVAWLYWVGLL